MTWTPEGAVKDKIKKFLASLGEDCWTFWPVQQGFGRRTVDLLGCYRGRMFACEVKAPGGEPTPIQRRELKKIAEAGGVSFWCDNVEDFKNCFWRFVARDTSELRPPG